MWTPYDEHKGTLEYKYIVKEIRYIYSFQPISLARLIREAIFMPIALKNLVNKCRGIFLTEFL